MDKVRNRSGAAQIPEEAHVGSDTGTFLQRVIVEPGDSGRNGNDMALTVKGPIKIIGGVNAAG